MKKPKQFRSTVCPFSQDDSDETSSNENEEEKGNALFDQVIKMTGVPANKIKNELKAVLDKKNIDVDQLTIDQLRQVAASYLREIMGGLLDRSEKGRSNS